VTTTKTSFDSHRYHLTTVMTPLVSEPSYPQPGLTTVTRTWTNDVTYGDNFPDWRERIREFRSATTSLAGNRIVVSCRPIEYGYTDPNHGGVRFKISGTFVPFSPPATINGVLESQVAATALQKFSSKARQKITTFQGGVSAGEFNETVKQLASPTKRLRHEVGSLLHTMLTLRRRIGKNPIALEREVVKASGKTFRSLRNAIADTWLEWSFGVKPLITDCQDAYLALRKLSEGRRFDHVSIKATHIEKERRFKSTATTGFVSNAAGFCGYDTWEEDECEVTYRAAYVWRRPDGNFPIPQLFGVDLMDIAPTAWELIPWSFFVDYFTDVGSAIEASSIRLADFAYVNRTVRNRRTLTMVNLRVNADATTRQIFKPSVYCPFTYAAKSTRYKVNRTAGLPPMEWYVPQLRSPKSDTKWLNIAALLNGVFQLRR
jgi:hypothetical protein